MTNAEIREACRLFIQKWQGKGKEDEDDRSFWFDIFTQVLGVHHVFAWLGQIGIYKAFITQAVLKFDFVRLKLTFCVKPRETCRVHQFGNPCLASVAYLVFQQRKQILLVAFSLRSTQISQSRNLPAPRLENGSEASKSFCP